MKNKQEVELRLVETSRSGDGSVDCMKRKLGVYLPDELEFQLELGYKELGYDAKTELALDVLKVYLPEFMAVARAQRRSRDLARKFISERLDMKAAADQSLKETPGQVTMIESMGELSQEEPNRKNRRRLKRGTG